MKSLNDYVCTELQGKELSDLGIGWKSFEHCWVRYQRMDNYVVAYTADVQRILENVESVFPAPHSGELGVMLPGTFNHNGESYWLDMCKGADGDYCFYYTSYFKEPFRFPNTTKENYFQNEAVTRADLLIYLLKNKLITVEEVNMKVLL
jgi:hypothetical protein